MDLKIIRPNIAYKASFLAGLKQFQAENLPWFLSLDYDWIEGNFKKYVESELLRATSRTDKFVPETKFWGIFEGEYAGKISVRHELNDSLRIMGGHIGYDTVPSFRIIEKNDGKLERRAVLDPGKPMKLYYWIEL